MSSAGSTRRSRGTRTPGRPQVRPYARPKPELGLWPLGAMHMGSVRPCTLRLRVPREFRLDTTARSHGWYDLPPFTWDNGTLGLVLRQEAGQETSPLSVFVRSPEPGVLTAVVHGLVARIGDVETALRRVLGLDHDLEAFYALCDTQPGFEWVRPWGAGRLLVAPTGYEDAVKVLLTTNCSWSLTKSMVGRLVELLGESTAQGNRAFPTPQAMASHDESFYRDQVRVGYRARALAEFAQAVAAGRVDPESWRGRDQPAEDVHAEILGLRGFGPYAAENLLRLTGHHTGLALDSWCRAKFARLYPRKRNTDDVAILRHYRAFGEWKGLALWCELTKDWHLVGVEAGKW